MSEPNPRSSRTAEALAQWREAERVASVARRGREAAEVAAHAADDAAKAARDTAAAVRAALAAARMADESATKTEVSARLVVEAATSDRTTSIAESEQADRDEAAARGRYQDAVAEAERRGEV